MTLLQVKVRPGARSSVLTEPVDGELWTAQLKSAPVEGKANAELVVLVAQRFGVARNRVTITGGKTARIKRVRIDDDA